MNILLTQDQELRSGWKFAFYWVLFAIFLIAISSIIPFGPGPETQLQRLVLNTIPLFPAIGALLIMTRFVDKAPIALFGVTFHERWPRDLNVGIAVGTGMLVALTLINGAIGGITMEWTASDASTRSLIITPIVLILSAAQEELVFRGYPLQVLMKGLGAWPAILTMSTTFGLVHLLNPNATLVGAVNTMLAGLTLSIAYLKTRSLWMPYGLHLGWNVGLGFVLGYPLSGIKIDSLWTTTAYGPQWLVGSAYGPEGGIIGTIVFAIAAIVIHKMRSVGISPKIRSLLAKNASQVQVFGE
jgi:membrane protease YdiL (CAAX protease family)